MKISVKSIGNQAEKEFATRMHNAGWWVHLLANNRNGQPLDVVMYKGNITWFIDIKNVANGDVFELSRIEPNQHSAFEMLMSYGSSNCAIVILFNDNVFYMLEYKMVKTLMMADIKTVTRDSLKKIV